MLTLGIPKGENLFEKTGQLLREVGMPMSRRFARSMQVSFPASSLLREGRLLQTRRVLYFVKEGHVDIGITGEDILAERGQGDVTVLARLLCKRFGLRETRISLFGSCDDPTPDLESIPQGSWLISEYPRLTGIYFWKRSDLTMDFSLGGCEAEVPLAYRFGVAVVDSGRTLLDNGLREIGVLFRSAPVLIAGKRTMADPAKKRAAEEFAAALANVMNR